MRFRNRQTGLILQMDCVGFQVKDRQTGEPRYVATVSRDMGERRALEQQLRHAQKFEAIGQLAGGIAHDFNNVIGAILGWAELGEEQAAANATLESYFKKIHAQCDRVTALVQQLLAFARRQILEPRNLSLNQTVQDVLNLLDKVIGKDIEIKTALAEDLFPVRADPTQIEQVLMNLCINSRDAMPTGGRLTIETRNVQFSPQDCRRDAALQPGSFAELLVRDTGTGMDAATRERIFEPFFTTKAMGKGTGLGLATVYGIVEQHNGFVQVESEVGQGSAFRIFLPANEAAEPGESEAAVVEEQPVRGGDETILMADDHEGVCEMAQSVLKAKGHRVLVAHDGEEAVRTIRRTPRRGFPGSAGCHHAAAQRPRGLLRRQSPEAERGRGLRHRLQQRDRHPRRSRPVRHPGPAKALQPVPAVPPRPRSAGRRSDHTGPDGLNATPLEPLVQGWSPTLTRITLTQTFTRRLRC